MRHLFIIACCILAAACSSGPEAWPESFRPEEYLLCLHNVDVGQGDALVLELPHGETWLVDAGGDPLGRFDVGSKRLLPWLRRRGIEQLDRVILTHFDADHYGGLEGLLGRIPIGEVWVPTRRSLGPRARRLMRSIEEQGVPINVVDEGARWTPSRPPIRSKLLHPFPGWDVEGLDGEPSANDGSIVLRIELGLVPFLLTGDVEHAAERSLLVAGSELRAAVLKVPHHGSKGSTSTAFLDAVDPLVATTGAGQGNYFLFPHASVRSRLLRRGLSFFWTGRQGNHRICSDGFGLWADAEEGGGRRFLGSWSAADLDNWRSRNPGNSGQKQYVAGAQHSVGIYSVCSETSSSKTLNSRTESRDRIRPKALGRGVAGKKGQVRRQVRDKPVERSTGETALSSPELLSEKDWSRRRRDRRRLRPPWRSP